MRRLALLSPLLVSFACGSATVAPDAGAPAADAAAHADAAAAVDAASTRDATAAEDAVTAEDASTTDATTADDATTGADDATTADAAADDDASAPADDASAPDASTPDAGAPPEPRALLVFLNGALFGFDPASGALSERGPTGYGELELLSPMWDEASARLYVIVDFTTAPTLATVDPCTGAVTRGPRITRGGAPVAVAEGLAFDPSGTPLASIKTTARPGLLTNTIGAIDLVTGEVTPRGDVSTVQDDVDQLVLGDGALYALDVDTAGGRAAIYRVDAASGATTLSTTVSVGLRRIVWDPDARRMLGATADTPDRRLVEVDLGGGTLTPIATTHLSAQHGGKLVDALALIPDRCPRELLLNPGFEATEDVCGHPSAFGDWAVDYSELTGATGGVTPRSGASMLRFVSNGFGAGASCGPMAGGASADVAQLVDVSACSAGTTLELDAHFDASAGAAPGTATCLLRAFTGTIADFSTASPAAEGMTQLNLDTDAASWQRCSTTLALPAGSRYVAAYLSAGSSARTRFADDASLRAIAGACP